MKKKDIKNSTIYIMIFTVVAFAAILLLRPTAGKQGHEKNRAAAGAGWSDTLTNRASNCELLYPMEKEIQRFMSRWNLKGVSIAVSRNDSLLYAKGLGWADMEKKIPMEASTISRMASASKLITATAVMKLVEQGRLHLTDTVFGPAGILRDPRYFERASDRRIYDITVENLLRHQGGFTLGAGDPMFNTVELKKAKRLDHAPDNDELISIVLGRRLGFTPGQGRKYSNFGYMLLSKVIEKVSGRSYWDYVREEVLGPAGCTGFAPATNRYADRYPNESRYYAPDDEQVEDFERPGVMTDRCYGGANINALMGAGGWCASAADLCRFVASIDGDPHLPDVIGKGSVDFMTRHEDKEKLAVGWTDSDASGKWTRSGTLSSAHALIERFPDGECWVIITNSGVWTGFHFTRDLSAFISRLRRDYSRHLPSRNLF